MNIMIIIRKYLMKLPPYKIAYSSTTKWAIYYIALEKPIEQDFCSYKEAKTRRYKMLKGAGRLNVK
jgi:hypothetical protein